MLIEIVITGTENTSAGAEISGTAVLPSTVTGRGWVAKGI
jgi:hypothetical protein